MKNMERRLKSGLQSTRRLTRKLFAKRAKKGELSKVHDISHVESVANHAKILAEELSLRNGFGKKDAIRIGILAQAAGQVHDIVRRATEKKSHGPQGASVILLSRAINPKAFGRFTQTELRMLAKATRVHETEFAEFENAIRSFSPAEKIVARAVHVADKLFEASGYRVLERRAFFVGKERLEKDLANFKQLYGPKAPLYAVTMESCMRLRAINVLEDYPRELQSIARPLHAVQEKWYFGLLKYLGLNEPKLAQEMERVNFPKFDKLGGKVKVEIEKANSGRQIAAINPDVANSAAELVMHFNKASSPDAALRTWKPKGTQAKEWLQGMNGARVGGRKYRQNLQAQIHKALTQ